MEEYSVLIKEGSKTNATFSLHAEMLRHCDEILALAVAERIGGQDGYNLMLSVVKTSLPFSFLNGASSYGAFCCRLLYERYSSGPFYQHMKQSFFSTPYRGSEGNFTLDTQREMEHRDALKGFRPRSTVTSVLPRMSLVDIFLDIESFREENNTSQTKENVTSKTWSVTRHDLNHIYPTAVHNLDKEDLT